MQTMIGSVRTMSKPMTPNHMHSVNPPGFERLTSGNVLSPCLREALYSYVGLEAGASAFSGIRK